MGNGEKLSPYKIPYFACSLWVSGKKVNKINVFGGQES
jgi:hypothetical protein